MQKEGTERLDFIQNIEYRFIELLSIDFINSLMILLGNKLDIDIMLWEQKLKWCKIELFQIII